MPKTRRKPSYNLHSPSGQPGFRVKTLIVATTFLDADEFTKDDLMDLYRARWNAELDLRSLKQTLQMDDSHGDETIKGLAR